MTGGILTRMASVPADYGIIAILDLTAALLSTLFAGGMVPAIGRHHFDISIAQMNDISIKSDGAVTNMKLLQLRPILTWPI